MTAATTAALRACAAGYYPAEAGTELLIRHDCFLRRRDFAGFVHTGTSITDGLTPMAQIDWDAAISALHAGQLPASGGERRILQLAASIAEGSPSPSATPSPAWTTATCNSSSPPSSTRQDNVPAPLTRHYASPRAAGPAIQPGPAAIPGETPAAPARREGPHRATGRPSSPSRPRSRTVPPSGT